MNVYKKNYLQEIKIFYTSMGNMRYTLSVCSFYRNNM